MKTAGATIAPNPVPFPNRLVIVPSWFSASNCIALSASRIITKNYTKGYPLSTFGLAFGSALCVAGLRVRRLLIPAMSPGHSGIMSLAVPT
jgi:hypothetical protein